MRIPLRRHARDSRASSLADPICRVDDAPNVAPLRLLSRQSLREADVLERELLGHTRRVARLRFVRGRLAHEFLTRKSWSRLGFVRVSDYVRECLGLSARTLQEDARAARALERLPQATIAFLESRLSWTQVRLLTLVARAEDEAAWIAAALASDTHTFEDKVRRRAESGDAPPIDLPKEPATQFHVRVSRHGRRLWRAAREMAERSAGSPLTPAQVLELIAAEAASGAPRPGETSAYSGESPSEPFHVLPGSPGPRGDLHGDLRSDSNDDLRGDERGDERRDPRGVEDAAALPTSARRHAARDLELEAFLRSVALNPDGESNEPPCARASEIVDRDPELTRFLAEIRAEQEAAAAAGVDWASAAANSHPHTTLFQDAQALLHQHLTQIAEEEDLPSLLLPKRGASPCERLEAVFDRIESREPRFLDARMREIGQLLQRADADLARLLREALETRLHRARGFASFARYVDEKLDFCSRTAWTLVAIDRASTRAGGDFVRAYREGRISLLAANAILPVIGPVHARAWIERAAAVTLRRIEAEVSWALDRLDAAGGAEAFFAPAPPPLDADLSSIGELLDPVRLKMRAQREPSAATPAPGDDAARKVTLRFSVPLSVAELVEEAMLALRRGSESRGEAFERMLAVVLLEWLAVPKHRDPVFERDGWRCAVPACSSRCELHDHHVRFRSLGGDENLDNRITVCAAHHLRGIHMGRVRATGRAPSEMVWELGCSQTGSQPYMRLVGDRYLVRPATCRRRPAAAVPNSVGSMPTPARKIA